MLEVQELVLQIGRRPEKCLIETLSSGRADESLHEWMRPHRQLHRMVSVLTENVECDCFGIDE
jgi:hypothetical protein